jgi:hypothetical protein
MSRCRHILMVMHRAGELMGSVIETGCRPFGIWAVMAACLGGLAIDVYEEEGIFFEDLSGEILQDDELSRLLVFPNVLVTAHQAFLTHEALEEIARVTVENMARAAECAGGGGPAAAGFPAGTFLPDTVLP